MDANDRRLLNRIQREVPLVERPYLALARELGLTEDEVVSRIEAMTRSGIIRSIGPVLDPACLALRSALVAVEVAPEALTRAADAVGAFPEVTHSYQRDHPINLWFTLTAATEHRMQEIVEAVRKITGVRSAVVLPARRKYKLSVQFDVTPGTDG